MAYSDDANSRSHKLGFYLRMRGIASRLSTHDPSNWPSWSPSGTFLAAIKEDSFSDLQETLDRDANFVDQGTLSFSVLDTDAVRSLFTIRGGIEAECYGVTTKTTTTISLKSGAAFGGTIPGTAYLGRETVTVSSHDGSGDHTVVRGVEDSTATRHPINTVLSDVPNHWYTREATLYAVHLETGTEKAIFTGTLSASPGFSDGLWGLELTGIIHHWLKRPLCYGWTEQEAIRVTETAAGNMQFEVNNAEVFSTETFSYFHIEGNGKSGIFGGSAAAPFSISTGSNPHTVVVDVASRRAGDLADASDIVGHPATIRQISFAEGRAGHLALEAILSDLGDGDNHSNYDVLPGVSTEATSENGHVVRRMGAAIPAARVDVDSFQQMPGVGLLRVWLDEQIDLGDFLANEVLRRSGGYVYATGDGTLTFRLYEPAVPTGSLTVYDRGTIGESNIVSRDDETDRLGRANIECNYHPAEREFRRQVEIVFSDDGHIYGEAGTSQTWTSKGIWVGALPTDTVLISDQQDLTGIEQDFDRQRARWRHAGRRTTLIVPWAEHVNLEIATRFKLSHPYMPDHEGGQGVTERVYEVTGRSLDFSSGMMTVEADEVPSGWLLAPSSEVASWNGGSLQLTLATTGELDELDDDNAPARDYPDTCFVRIYDASANFATSEREQVASIVSDTVIQLSAGPGAFTPAAGDLIVLEDSDNTGNTNDIGADVQDFSFGSDSSGLVGTGQSYERTGPKWG